MAFKKFSEVAPQTSLDIAFGPLSEMLGNHGPSGTDILMYHQVITMRVVGVSKVLSARDGWQFTRHRRRQLHRIANVIFDHI